MNKTILKKYTKNIAIIILIAIFFIADRYLKLVAIDSAMSGPFNLINNFFSFNFTPNYFIAFSLPLSGIFLNILILVLIAALIFAIFYLILKNKEDRLTIMLLTIILFGSISNILDRLIYGYVIDYLELRYFTVFNLADAGIFIGASFLIIYSFFKQNNMEKAISAENLSFVLDALKRATVSPIITFRRITPAKENAIQLLILHDLVDLIAPAKKEGAYDQALLEKILVGEYKKRFSEGNCSLFYNFRRVLQEPEYFEHFCALLYENTVSKNQLN